MFVFSDLQATKNVANQAKGVTFCVRNTRNNSLGCKERRQQTEYMFRPAEMIKEQKTQRLTGQAKEAAEVKTRFQPRKKVAQVTLIRVGLIITVEGKELRQEV